MSKYIPEIGEKFKVKGKGVVYTRCDEGTLKELFGFPTEFKVPEENILYLVENPRSLYKFNWWFFAKDGVDFEPAQIAVPKPPLGIMPLRVHNSVRLQALLGTLQRYAEAQRPVLPEWITEVKDLVEYERSLTREALDKVPFKL